MHFAFTDQQLEFRDAVRQVLAKECTPDDVRAAYDAPSARSPRWATLADLGVVGLAVPDSHGGLGLGLVDLVPLVEEAGRVVLPEPLIETAGLAAPLLGDLERAATTDARIGPWLHALTAGQLTVAVGEPGRPGLPIAGAVGADLLLLVVDDGPDGPELHGVDGATVSVTPVPSLDPTRRLGNPVWSPSPESVLVSGNQAAGYLSGTSDRAAVLVGAELLGLADAMITLASSYAKDRQQFGKPIGSFQAVKHLLAGAQVLLEFARPAVYGAAWALDVGNDGASVAASVAKAYATEAATEAARVALQVHGAIGYTWECDLHLYLKRTWALSEAWGSAADHRARLLEALLADR